MKPLILEFAESPLQEDQDWASIEYSEKLHLSVLKGSETPAVNFLAASTKTLTKAGTEGSDTDSCGLGMLPLMATCTYTSNSKETTDSDPLLRNLQNLLATKTVTRSIEDSDSDA